MKFIRKLYEFVVFTQFILVFFFIFENINNLEEVDYKITIFDTQYDFSLNIYATIAVIVVFFGALMLVSVNVFGIGLNDAGTINASRLISMIAMLSMLSLASTYYILQLGNIGNLIHLGMALVYLFYGIDRPNQSEDYSE